MFCGETSIVATSNFGQVAMPVKCKRWGCPNCVEWKANCLMARCIEGRANRFITITCREGQFGSKEANAAAIAKAWRTAVQRWRRSKNYHRCEYICVFEPHENGWPHLHVLWKGHWIDQKWLSRQMQELLNSPIVHVSKIKGARSAAFYVGKYFSKEPEKFGNSKRYWTSKNWPKLSHIDATKAFHKGFPTDIVKTTIDAIFYQWERLNKNPRINKDGSIAWGILWEPPRPEPKYPKPTGPWRSMWPTMPLARPRAPKGRAGEATR